jgi:O-methyltransferase
MQVLDGLRHTIARAARRATGRKRHDVMTELIRHHAQRWEAFIAAIDYVNFEAIPGDIVEFGVFGGASLAMLAKAQSFDPKGMHRRIVGFDSFRGLPQSRDQHPRWRVGDCATNHSWHPLVPVGAPLTAQSTLDLFRACELSPPELEVGLFGETVLRAIPSRYQQIAVAHIDCDLYESTSVVLDGIGPVLSDGCVLMFDDWFHYKGNPHKGEALAFSEFLERNPGWGSQPYLTYGTFCKSFVLYRK